MTKHDLVLQSGPMRFVWIYPFLSIRGDNGADWEAALTEGYPHENSPACLDQTIANPGCMISHPGKK
jgi:hypothetical protein